MSESSTNKSSTLPDEVEGFVHQALFYGSDEEYRAEVGRFVRNGLDAGEPALVAVPGPKADLLHDVLGTQAGDGMEVAFTDMAELGRNPARIIPTVRGFVDDHRGHRVRFVGEPIWPGRTWTEVREATRHEALINTAFADTESAILCPYDLAGLSDGILVDAEYTHPEVMGQGSRWASSLYVGPTGLPPEYDEPLPAPPGNAASFTFVDTDELASIRSFVTEHATQAGFGADRVAELVLAVTELAANTLRHTGGGGTLHLWQPGDRVICQVADGGRITDPLADRRPPPQGTVGSRGLWLVNQLCDLTELRSHDTGTTHRLHMFLG